jgi:hypothetical protein
MMYISPDSIRLFSVFVIPTNYEPRLIPRLGNSPNETMGDGVKFKREKGGCGMGKWKYDIFGYSVSQLMGWCCVLKQAECTLYHCIWCCASVSAFSQEIWKNGFDCEQQRETESERERMNGGVRRDMKTCSFTYFGACLLRLVPKSNMSVVLDYNLSFYESRVLWLLSMLVEVYFGEGGKRRKFLGASTSSRPSWHSDRSLNLQMTPEHNGKCVLANAHSESVKIFFLSFRWIPKSIVVTKENVAAVAEAIYLLEYKFLCSVSREPRWLLIIYFRRCVLVVYQESIFLSILKICSPK